MKMAKARPAKGKGKADYRVDVDRRLATLRGQSLKELETDDRRGASSPIGHGAEAARRKGR